MSEYGLFSGSSKAVFALNSFQRFDSGDICGKFSLLSTLAQVFICNGIIVLFNGNFHTFGARSKVDYNIFQLWSSFFQFGSFCGSRLSFLFSRRADKGITVFIKLIFGQLAENRKPACELHILQLKLLAVISVLDFGNGELPVIKLNHIADSKSIFLGFLSAIVNFGCDIFCFRGRLGMSFGICTVFSEYFLRLLNLLWVAPVFNNPFRSANTVVYIFFGNVHLLRQQLCNAVCDLIPFHYHNSLAVTKATFLQNKTLCVVPSIITTSTRTADTILFFQKICLFLCGMRLAEILLNTELAVLHTAAL